MNRQDDLDARSLTPRQRANLHLLLLEIEIRTDLKKRIKQPVEEPKCFSLA